LKKINLPAHNDDNELDALAQNTRLCSYPYLSNNSAIIKQQYKNYTITGGDPWSVASCNLPLTLQGSLITHYGQPPKNRLQFLDEFRNKLSPNFCPMCGGFGLGTLDHYLPKSDFPQFSIFSQNLIPACSCNAKRGVTVKGDSSPKRVIHPYFDTFLKDRLFKASFRGGYKDPSISVCVINSDHPNIDILEFHLEKVILKNNIIGWLEGSWSDLRKRPYDLLEIVLPEKIAKIDDSQLDVSIKRYLRAKDKEYGTPNNWWSIFYYGLLQDKQRLASLVSTINNFRGF